MGGSGGPDGSKKKEKKPKKEKKDRYVDKDKAIDPSASAAAAGTSSMTDVTYTLDQLKDADFWRSKPELKDAPGSRWKYAPDDAFEELLGATKAEFDAFKDAFQKRKLKKVGLF
jgi:hypothetical protein|eukprot:COSAG02_NODE_1039_length_15040_cov_70.746737_1_plen_114_part_00